MADITVDYLELPKYLTKMALYMINSLKKKSFIKTILGE